MRQKSMTARRRESARGESRWVWEAGQVVTTDCEEGLREEQDREKQRMRDERGLSLCNLLHCDGVYLPTLHQQYPPCVCVCVSVQYVWLDAEHCTACALLSMLSIRSVLYLYYQEYNLFLNSISPPVNQTENEFLFCITLVSGCIKDWAFVILVTHQEMPRDCQVFVMSVIETC